MLQDQRKRKSSERIADTDDTLSQIISDVEGLERLQVMQLKLIREVSRRLKMLTSEE